MDRAKRCCGEVKIDTSWPRYTQCSRIGKVLRGNKWYCGIHDPEARAAKQALKRYCAVNGPVNVKGVEFDNRPIEQVVYPVEDVLRVLKERGLFGAFEERTIPRSALSQVFKSFPQVETDLASVAQRSTSYRFSARKHDEESDDE